MRDVEQRANGAARVSDPLDGWPAFVAAARARLEQGRSAYRDRSFERDPSELLAEISAELLDTCTWSFILWSRLQRIAADVVGKLDTNDEADRG